MRREDVQLSNPHHGGGVGTDGGVVLSIVMLLWDQGKKEVYSVQYCA